jgi:phosphopantothenoylcysteine decarboxylase/phosphopantothenate--cysteine ligase
MANLANGSTPDIVALTALATAAPILLAPAMDNQMWEHAATRLNLETLRARGVAIVGPESGRLASGRSGPGRMAEPLTIVGALRALLGVKRGDLGGRHIVVSAGGTREAIDPVRFIGNHSTGLMGFAIAEAARDRGARVTLVTAPVALPAPYGIELVDVTDVASMLAALETSTANADAIVMAAAPADFRPASAAGQKIKKQEGQQALRLELVKNPDIIATLEGGGVRVGFAAETNDLATYAKAKLASKRLDFIVANDVTAPGSGFGTTTNEVVLFHRDGREEHLPLMEKLAVGHAILDRVAALMPSS